MNDQDPLKTFLMKAKLAIHYLQSKYCLNSEWLVELDTSSTYPVITTKEGKSQRAA